MPKIVTGFSKLTKAEKIEWLISRYFHNDSSFKTVLESYWNHDQKLQELHDEFIENTITNFYLPFAVAPNFLINQRFYTIPMVIEESSVVAAAGNAAKFWSKRGGFRAEVISTTKNGQIHFNYNGNKETLISFFEKAKPRLLASVEEFSDNMRKRGGGIKDISLVDKTDALENYYHLHCTFETADAMGANFINSCLEQIAKAFKEVSQSADGLSGIEIVMSILSNYVPECLVRAEAGCTLDELSFDAFNGKDFAQKFVRAVAIAKAETRRAVTHNKGIMNGIDAVILATGNDFRAVEAGVHAYAARNGYYSSLTDAKIEGDVFTFSIEIPLALGTVGGMTSLHPLVKMALAILEKPNAKELMQIIAVAGLAQNFAAIKSLITTGIQQGHMKMHLLNILNQMNATGDEKKAATDYFKKHKITHSGAIEFIENMRK